MTAISVGSVSVSVVEGYRGIPTARKVHVNTVDGGGPSVYGVVRRDGLPVRRVISLIDPVTGHVLAFTRSNWDGVYIVPAAGKQAGDEVARVVFDEGTGAEGDPVLGHIIDRVLLE